MLRQYEEPNKSKLTSSSLTLVRAQIVPITQGAQEPNELTEEIKCRYRELESRGFNFEEVSCTAKNQTTSTDLRFASFTEGKDHPLNSIIHALEAHPILPTAFHLNDSILDGMNAIGCYYKGSEPNFRGPIYLHSKTLLSQDPYKNSYGQFVLNHELQHRYVAMLRKLKFSHPMHVVYWRENKKNQTGYEYFASGCEVYTQFANAKRKLLKLKNEIQDFVEQQSRSGCYEGISAQKYHHFICNQINVFHSAMGDILRSMFIASELAYACSVAAKANIRSGYFLADGNETVITFKEKYSEGRRRHARLFCLGISQELFPEGAITDNRFDTEAIKGLCQFYSDISISLSGIFSNLVENSSLERLFSIQKSTRDDQVADVDQLLTTINTILEQSIALQKQFKFPDSEQIRAARRECIANMVDAEVLTA